jgi:urea transport system ATP-binding protein
MLDTILEIEGLEQFYGGSHILWDLSIDVPDGEVTCLMGRNGVGKTTLLKSIMGLVSIAGGEIRFAGRKLDLLRTEQRARSGIGYVPQGREIFAQLTVEENLRVGLASSQGRVGEIPGSVYELFPVLREMLGRRGGDLSGGQQQQLAIARALVSNPSLLILDEPTEGIQPNIVKQIGDVILELNRTQGLSVLIVEQKLAFARRVANRFVIMDRGRSVATGEIEALNEGLVRDHLMV